MTPDRPTSSGLQSLAGAPMQFGPSPQTQEYSRHSPCCVPPAQWGSHYARESGDEECELFGDVPPGHEENPLGVPAECEAHQDELDHASTPPSDVSPSTACQASTACTPEGAPLGKAPPGFDSPPGIVPSRRIPPLHLRQRHDSKALPPLTQSHVQGNGHLYTPDRRRQEEAVQPKVQEEEEQGQEPVTSPIHQEEDTHQDEGLQEEVSRQ